METEFIYWRHPTLPGIKVEEISGREDKKGGIWREMARQVYCENGRDGYRELGHYRNGAPFIHGEECRISISHADGLYVVATLPATPEVDLSGFTERAALGIDVERENREQALKIRDKYLSEEEKLKIPEDDIEKNIIAWTSKEACYKAVLGGSKDFIRDIRLIDLPQPGPSVPVYDKNEFPEIIYGKALVSYHQDRDENPQGDEPAEGEVELILYSYKSDGFIVTVAYSAKSAKFSKEKH